MAHPDWTQAPQRGAASHLVDTLIYGIVDPELPIVFVVRSTNTKRNDQILRRGLAPLWHLYETKPYAMPTSQVAQWFRGLQDRGQAPEVREIWRGVTIKVDWVGERTMPSRHC